MSVGKGLGMFGNEAFFDGKSVENVSNVEVLKVPEAILHILGCRAPSVRTALACSEVRVLERVSNL